MGKYNCTREDVEEVLGDALPEDVNRNDILDALRHADERVSEVVEQADASALDAGVLERRMRRMTANMAAHRVLLVAGELDPDVSLKHRSSLDNLARIRNGAYAGEEPAAEEEAEVASEEDEE